MKTKLLALLFHSLKASTAQEWFTATSQDDGPLPFHAVTVLASHNAHANRAAASSFFETLGINQENSIYDQLAVDGVRALLMDIKLDSSYTNDPLRLVHEPLDYGGFGEEMFKNLVPFLEEDENAVVSLYLQAVGDTNTGNDEGIRAEMLEQLKVAFDRLEVNGLPLKQLTFKFDDAAWESHDEWPTMNELRQAKQRVFVFSDRSEFFDQEYGFMHNQHVMQENDWQGIGACISRFMWQSLKVSFPTNTKNWSRLFMMNHYCCDAGAQSYGTVIPNGSPLLGGGDAIIFDIIFGDNGWGILYPRIKICMDNNGGVKPNFIALDWVIENEQARSVANFMNFGGALGTRQLCDSNEYCATSSCNNALGLCQCEECDTEGCGGCESGQICIANNGGLNECLTTQISQFNVTREEQVNVTQEVQVNASQQELQNFTQELIYYCAESYSEAVDNCSVAVQCDGRNDDCPADQVCFGPFECPSGGSLLSQLTQNSSSPESSPENSPSPSVLIETSTMPVMMETTEPPVTPVTMYCGESYEAAKETCGDSTACPGGYECPSGQVCFAGIKCFTQPPTGAPSSAPTTSSPSAKPTEEPTTVAPVAPSSSPTSRPTRAPFDFSNEYFCGTNFTDARENCYFTTPCPGGDPTVCADGETCYNGIKCIAPPSMSPTFTPTFTPPTISPVSFDNAPSQAGTVEGGGVGIPNGVSGTGGTNVPFVWEDKSSGERFNFHYMFGICMALCFILQF